MAEVANVGRKVQWIEGQHWLGIALQVQSQTISLQAKVVDPSSSHKLLLCLLHSPSCSKSVSCSASIAQ